MKKTAAFYRKNKKSYAKKLAKDREYQNSEEGKKKRAKRKKDRSDYEKKNGKIPKGKDLDHGKKGVFGNGKKKVMSASKNRGKDRPKGKRSK